MTEETLREDGQEEELSLEAQMQAVIEEVDNDMSLVMTMLESYPESKDTLMSRLAAYDERIEKGDRLASLEKTGYISLLAYKIEKMLTGVKEVI